MYDNYPASQWRNWYTNNKTANPSLVDCTAPTPYYNGQTCIACSDPNFPYFDLVIKDCVRCPTGSSYSNGQCIFTSSSALSPNLASMAATAFTHQSGIDIIDIPYPQHQRHRIE